MSATWRIASPGASAGALAVVEILAPGPRAGASIDAALRSCGVGELRVGEVALRDLIGVDRGVAARWSEGCVHLTPHGGRAVVGAISRVLHARLGPAREVEPDPMVRYPEAATRVEALMLAALARAASPAAVDLLLDQPRRWDEANAGTGPGSDPARDAALAGLLGPVLVVAVGPANVGKSTLLNALAGRGVSVVADEPGTTRDYVGVLLDLGGVVVRYVDTPGVRTPRDEAECGAMGLAMTLARGASVVVECVDPATEGWRWAGIDRRRVLRAGLRADLGGPGFGEALDACVSVREGRGVDALAGLIRERAVPSWAMAHAGAWRFWGEAE